MMLDEHSPFPSHAAGSAADPDAFAAVPPPARGYTEYRNPGPGPSKVTDPSSSSAPPSMTAVMPDPGQPSALLETVVSNVSLPPLPDGSEGKTSGAGVSGEAGGLETSGRAAHPAASRIR
jgi:hypothetical protein